MDAVQYTDTKDYYMQYLFFGDFRTHPPVDMTRSQDNIDHQLKVLKSIKDIFPNIVEDTNTDFEDFFELASTLASAINYGDCWLINGPDMDLEPLKSAPITPNPDIPISILGAYKNAILPEDADRKVRCISAKGTAWPVLSDINLAKKYPFSQTFKKYANRWSEIAGLESEAFEDGASSCKYDRSIYSGEYGVWTHSPPSTADIMASQSALGVDKVFVKVNKDKYFAGNIQLTRNMTIKQANSTLMSILEYGMVHLAGYSDIMQVQESVKMEYEYRIVMIDGEPVTGAGCVEEFTPLDNISDFDVRARQTRAPRTSITEMPKGLLEKYIELAKEFSNDIYNEAGLRNYVLDLCTINGKPSVVELNSCYNFGFYACNVDKIVIKLTQYAENNVQSASTHKASIPHAPPTNTPQYKEYEDSIVPYFM